MAEVTANTDKTPRTARGQKTRAKILEAARIEFGKNGFGETSIVGITSRAKVALGTFYTYFDSKEELFSALVRDMSGQVGEAVAPALEDADDAIDAERRALSAFLDFARDHREVYRIIDEAEFVDPDGFRAHYEAIAKRIADRLHAGEKAGEITATRDATEREVRAWALMGMNVFLGLRFSVWGQGNSERIATDGNRMIAKGIER